ncbi:group 2 truncated hemoglobin YjbI [Robertmurraya siralis]|uniref:Group 2 truncated hemoglobin YjbI n=1 Tax=Robertmurraya siralis TaxID=77777 RepID=A0A919WJ42_9BACI|nr:globin [Robertmurraya siralis]PAE20675.1 globin [Bacillus sp. 7504-2]GIN62981.1 group 2 truncated hemoglobin YjbI [Robertmurraya siralis]
MEHMPTPFEAIGEEKLAQLIDAFYRRVEQHPELAPIFPADLSETARKQKQFMTQFLGGPPIYTEEHGHPMLRARHMPFQITESRAKAWLACMKEAMDEVGLDGMIREAFFSRLVLTAQHMINSPEKEDMKGEDL